MFEFYDPCASCTHDLYSYECISCKYNYPECLTCPYTLDSAECWGNEDCPYES